MNELTIILYALVTNNQKPPKELAKSVNKLYSTLMREVNPHDKGAKLSVETLLQLMLETGDVTPLEYMAEQVGYRLSPLDPDGVTQDTISDKKDYSAAYSFPTKELARCYKR